MISRLQSVNSAKDERVEQLRRENATKDATIGALAQLVRSRETQTSPTRRSAPTRQLPQPTSLSNDRPPWAACPQYDQYSQPVARRRMFEDWLAIITAPVVAMPETQALKAHKC